MASKKSNNTAGTSSTTVATQARPPSGSSRATHKMTFAKMIIVAIKEQNERGGSSLQSIKKFLKDRYLVNIEESGAHIRKSLCRLVEEKKLLQTSGIGANGSFKLPPEKKVRTLPKNPLSLIDMERKKAAAKAALALSKKGAAEKVRQGGQVSGEIQEKPGPKSRKANMVAAPSEAVNPKVTKKPTEAASGPVVTAKPPAPGRSKKTVPVPDVPVSDKTATKPTNTIATGPKPPAVIEELADDSRDYEDEAEDQIDEVPPAKILRSALKRRESFSRRPSETLPKTIQITRRASSQGSNPTSYKVVAKKVPARPSKKVIKLPKTLKPASPMPALSGGSKAKVAPVVVAFARSTKKK